MIRGRFITSMDDISRLIKLRKEVFIDELALAYPEETDELDKMAVYAQVFGDDDDVIATGRLCIADDHFNISKVCVKKELRGRSIGDFVMRLLLYRAQELNAPDVGLSSDTALTPFFERYGFRPFGETYHKYGQILRNMKVTADEINIEGTCGGKAACAGCSRNCEECNE